MKKGYTISYANEYFRCKDGYNYLKIDNDLDKNGVILFWWDEENYKYNKYANLIGQWRIKTIK